MIPPRVAIFSVYRQDSYMNGKNDIFTEIVLLDRTFSQAHPLLYRLHYNALAQSQPINQDAQNQAELISGEVLSIKKSSKEIFLKDGSTVRYKYLIVISGDKSLESHYNDTAAAVSAGISTLHNALRVQPQAEQAFKPPRGNQKIKKRQIQPGTTPQVNMDSIVVSASLDQPSSTNLLINARLSEIQL